jgi:hypothetical protein
MSGPGYDSESVTIRVSLQQLKQAATVDVPNHITSIADSLNSIVTTLGNLKLSWIGSSATQATDFSNQWQLCMTSLFGTTTTPEAGLLVQYAGGLATAFANYDQTEDAMASMFGTMAMSIAYGPVPRVSPVPVTPHTPGNAPVPDPNPPIIVA